MKTLKYVLSLVALIAILVVSLGIATQPAAAEGMHECLPSCNTTDGRMLSIASIGYSTLAGQTIYIKIAAPQAMPSFQIGIFDGDTSGIWDQGSIALIYTLYADPTNVESDLVLLQQWSGSSMANNDWTDLTIAQDARAQAPSGDYFYSLRIDLPDASTVKTWSNFKIRSDTPIEMSTNHSFAYAVPLLSQAETDIIYPQGVWKLDPATWELPTTFDGTWDLYFTVPVPIPSFEIYDGDMDYGSYDCSVYDTNDPDTSDVGIPSWAIGISDVPEGNVSSTELCRNPLGQVIRGPEGQVYATGAPADDNRLPRYRRSPSITYDVIDPDGNEYHNANPSGNSEWERFIISSDANTPADHQVDGMLPAGTYHIRVNGLDLTNLNAWHPTYDLRFVREDGTPADVPVLHPYIVGDTIWNDFNGNGIQDDGEPGIPGVSVTLIGAYDYPLATAITDANGNYTFKVDAGTYSVQVNSSNFNAGGALVGLSSTTGGNTQMNTVTIDNVLTYDFGFLQVDFCSYIRTPGFWKNYKNHMSEATFLGLVSHTQHFNSLTVEQAVTILKKNNGTTKMGIGDLDGVNARYLKFLLTAEINAAWNGQDNAATLSGLMGTGIYQGTGMTVNQALDQAYINRRNFSSAENAWVLYLGGEGEGVPASSCQVQP